ncbi:MAG: 2-C-methyl-D-erythritol 2,4-cyclodiphosphate synthase [Fidelibacterota bacterium]
MGLRIGFGYDIHPLEKGRRLILGGVEISFHLGLQGHSDADVLIHAIIDSLLGASALGDIGTLFPDTDEAYRGISSLKLLEKVLYLLRDNRFKIVNIDSTLVVDRPKIAPYVEKMRRRLSDMLWIPADCISIKAKTSEGLGPVGEGRAIEAYAVAYIKK